MEPGSCSSNWPEGREPCLPTSLCSHRSMPLLLLTPLVVPLPMLVLAGSCTLIPGWLWAWPWLRAAALLECRLGMERRVPVPLSGWSWDCRRRPGCLFP